MKLDLLRAFRFIKRRFFNAKILFQLDLDLINGGFIVCGFIRRRLLYSKERIFSIADISR